MPIQVSLFFIAVISFTSILSAQEITDSEQTDSVQTTCMENFRKYNCKSLLQSKATAHTVNMCDGKDKPLRTLDWTKTCLSQGAGIWAESIHSLQKAPEAIINSVSKSLQDQSKPRVALIRWELDCKASKSCIANLIKGSQKQKIPQSELHKKAKNIHGKIQSSNPFLSWRGHQLFNFYYQKTSQRNSLGKNSGSWYHKEMDKVFGTRKTKSYPSIVEVIKDKVDSYHKLNCLKSKEQTAARCFLFFSIADPTAALTLAKAPKIAKLLKELKKGKKKKTSLSDREKKNSQESRALPSKELSPKKNVADMDNSEFVQNLALLDTYEKLKSFVNKLSDKDLKVFAKKVDRYSSSSRQLIASKKYDDLRLKLASDPILPSKVEEFARPYMAQVNRRRNLSPPSGKVAASTNGKNFHYIDSAGVQRGSARVQYEPGSHQLYIDKRETLWRDSGRGIQKAIFESILKKYPNTRTVKSVFVRSNADSIKAGLDRGLSFEEAVKLSPAYRIAEKFGYKKVIQSGSSVTEAIFSK